MFREKQIMNFFQKHKILANFVGKFGEIPKIAFSQTLQVIVKFALQELRHYKFEMSDCWHEECAIVHIVFI
jgi:hypothetical protein